MKIRLSKRRLGFAAGLLSFACCASALAAPAGNATFETVRDPLSASDARQNENYQGNRAPLQPSPLIALPLGSIRPRGWLRGQLEAMAQGAPGHLPEVSNFLDFDHSAWAHGEGTHPGEEVPYWLRGFVDLGYVLQDRAIIAESERWLHAVMATQSADGYFGPAANKARDDFWPNDVLAEALVSYSEATNDARVVPLLLRYYLWKNTLDTKRLLALFWAENRAGDSIKIIYWLYNRTGDARLLELARKTHENMSDWTSGIASWHGVNTAEGFREPAQFFPQAHDRALLAATERNYATVMQAYGQVPGGAWGADEYARPGFTDPRQMAETCTLVEMMRSDEILLEITGDPVQADRCEDIALNSLPAAATPDWNSVHYLTAPNLVQIDRQNKAPMIRDADDKLTFNARLHRCCQHNSGMGWPKFAAHLWMAAPDNGLAAIFYASSEVEAFVGDHVAVKIGEKTDYPFDDTVEFTIGTSAEVVFPLMLRIPGWCTGAQLSLNDEPVAAQLKAGSYFVVRRHWHDGDRVRLRLPMNVRVATWEKNMHTVSVSRGPLTYALRIREEWKRYGGSDRWPAYEVLPASAWNFGLVLDETDATKSFRFVPLQGALPAQPFVNDAPVKVLARGKRIPPWQLETNGLIGSMQESPVTADGPTEDIELIPMGAARLRVAAFPAIASGGAGHTWTPTKTILSEVPAAKRVVVETGTDGDDLARILKAAERKPGGVGSYLSLLEWRAKYGQFLWNDVRAGQSGLISSAIAFQAGAGPTLSYRVVTTEPQGLVRIGPRTELSIKLSGR